MSMDELEGLLSPAAIKRYRAGLTTIKHELGEGWEEKYKQFVAKKKEARIEIEKQLAIEDKLKRELGL